MSLKKILLVDDDRALNFLNKLTLKANAVDCEVAEAFDGRQALNYLSQHDECPDVILLDINMPGIDGFGFLKEYEKRGRCCERSKIFMLTSSVRDEDKQAAFSSGYVTGYFDKPLSKLHIQQILSATS